MDKGINRPMAFAALRAFLIGLSVSMALICIFALIMYFFETGYKYAPVFATISLGAGVFAAAFYMAAFTKKKGLLIGLATGGAVFILLTLISLILNRDGLTVNTLFRFIIIMLSALMGGVMGVNRQSKRKYI